MIHPAIVMYMGPTGLGIIRSLGKFGIPIIGMDKTSKQTGFKSRYCQEQLITEDPVAHPDQCLETLLNYGKTLDSKAVLLPAADAYVKLISNNEEALSEFYSFNVPKSDLLKKIVDKKQQYALAIKYNVPIANTVAPATIGDLELILDTLRFPLFVKGLSSAIWNEKYKQKGFLVTDVAELKTILSTIFAIGIEPIVQEVITGPNTNHFKVCAYYTKNRELKCVFSTKKSRQYPADFGIGTYMESAYREDLINTSTNFLERIGYNGVGSIEYKLDDRDNIFKFIELNPRFWQQNFQSTCAGVNFSLANYNDCLGREIQLQDKFKDNVIWIDSISDFRSFTENHKKGRIKILPWLTSLKKINCHSYYSNDDIKPSLYRFVMAFTSFPGFLKRKAEIRKLQHQRELKAVYD